MYLYIILTNCDLNKVADILQMSFQNAFIWKNSPNIYQTKIAQMDCWFEQGCSSHMEGLF